MRFYHIAFVAVLVASGSSVSVAQDASTKEVEIKSSLSEDGKVTPCLRACTINFQKELGASFGYLVPLGSQVHKARVDLDPVTLVVAAKSLEAAETATGQKAKVTADQIMTEAIEIAQLRGDAKELKAIAHLVSDAKVQAQLNQLAEAAEDSASEAGEESRKIMGDIRVINHTGHDLYIQVDGRNYSPPIPAGRTRDIHVHAHDWHNHLDAYCLDDNELVQHGDWEGYAKGGFNRPALVWHIHE